jgi:hypothetical protein
MAAVVDLIESVLASHPPVSHASIKEVRPNSDKVRYIENILADNQAFDALGLRRQLWDSYQEGLARLRVFSCTDTLSTIILVEPTVQPVAGLRKILRLWARIFSIFGVRGARITWFAHPSPRLLGPAGVPPGPDAVNGGYCIRGSPDTIVIYRAEDATRVLIHELLHATWSDSHRAITVPAIEAETEAWAEVIYALLIDGREGLRHQLEYAVKQNRLLRDNYGVHGPSAYAWRYTVGREAVWLRMGLLPIGRAQGTAVASTRSLSLTAEPLPRAQPASKN